MFINFVYIQAIISGSFQKFYTLYVFSLKMNSFYKIHLQAFNVISIVFYQSGPTFGQVLYSCQDAFVVDASDYSGHLIRHLLNASEAFPTEGFFFNYGNKSKSGGLMSGLYGRWGSNCRPYFSQISDTAPEA
jgi:hypothetical protein